MKSHSYLEDDEVLKVTGKFRTDGMKRDGSFDCAMETLRNLDVNSLTLRDEVELQKYILTQISSIEGVKLHEDKINRVMRERLGMIPKRQMDEVGHILKSVLETSNKISTQEHMALVREITLRSVYMNELSTPGMWFLCVHIQSFYTPVEQMIDQHSSLEQHDGTKSLNKFLDKFPHFRTGFNASITSNSKKIEYIKEVVEPRLDLLEIGMKDATDGIVAWYKIDKTIPLKHFLARYGAIKGMSSVKTLVFKYKGQTLFSGHRKKDPSALGMKDRDLISVSIRQPTLSTERVPLKELHKDNGRSKHKVRTSKKKANGNRKSSFILVPQHEEETLRRYHMKAMASVFEEAGHKFTEIRKRLNDMNLKRTPPKDKSKPSKPPPILEPANNLPSEVVAAKAGKSHFMVRVGNTNTLYRTTKKLTKARVENNILIDLHGLTKDQALAKLDESIPIWMDIAMKESYPFVIQVKIVCGGGNQILAEAVERWIREKKNVANAPKNHIG